MCACVHWGGRAMEEARLGRAVCWREWPKAWAEVAWRAIPPGVGPVTGSSGGGDLCGQQCGMVHAVAPSGLWAGRARCWEARLISLALRCPHVYEDECAWLSWASEPWLGGDSCSGCETRGRGLWGSVDREREEQGWGQGGVVGRLKALRPLPWLSPLLILFMD